MSSLLKNWILGLVPQVLKRAIIHDYKDVAYANNQGFHQISYAQQGEDILASKYFENQPKGFYVDIGAFHPVTYSNTFHFYQRGWRGINIDPSPATIKLFNQVRKEDLNLQCAIAAERREHAYYIFNHGAINTLDSKHAQYWSALKGFDIVDQVPVMAFPLAEILDAHLPPHMKIDFMSIDVEGYDLEVLQSNNWIKYRPTLLMVEEHITSSNDFAKSEILRFLENNHYKVHSICNGTIAMIDVLPNK